MIPHLPSLACCTILALGAAGLHAQTTLRWIVDPARPAPADWTIFQGETVLLEPAFASYGDTLPLTNVTAALYWQTNGMDAAWWTVPAEIITGATPRVRATWAPTNDCGAARYSYFISLAAPGGLSYRAYGRLTMRPSPGATPSILAAPTTLTDALAAWGDGRYEIAGTAQATSNALAGALLAEAAARISGDVEALHTTWPATGTVARAAHLARPDGVYWQSISNGAAVTWRAVPDTNRLYIVSTAGDYNGPAAGRVFVRGDDDLFASVPAGWYAALTGPGWTLFGAEYIWGGGLSLPATLVPQFAIDDYYASGTVVLDYAPVTNAYPEAIVSDIAEHNTNSAAHADIRAAIPTNTATLGQITSATNALAGDIITGNLPVQRWQMYDWGWSTNRLLILTNDYIEIWEKN